MPTFAMLSTLGPDGSARLAENPERIREVSQEVEAMGVRVLQQWAVLGQWDFLNIIDAPDEAAMARLGRRPAGAGGQIHQVERVRRRRTRTIEISGRIDPSLSRRRR